MTVSAGRATARLLPRAAAAGLVACSLACVILLVPAVTSTGRIAAWLTCAHWIVSGLAAVFGTTLAWVRVRTFDVPDRGGWGLLVVGQVLWLVAVVVYDWYVLTDSFPTSPTVSDLLWLAAGVVSAVGVRRLARTGARRGDVSWTELAPLGAAVCVLLLVVLWPDIQSSTLGLPAVVTILAYPVIYVSLALVMLQAVVSGSLPVRHNWGLAVVLAGLVIEAFTFVAWAPPLLLQDYQAGHSVLDSCWSIGMVLIGLGAWRARPWSDRADLTVRHRGGVLPTVSFLLLSAVQIHATNRDTRMGALSIGVGMVGVLLAIRGSVLRRANAELQHDSRTDPLMGISNRLRMTEDLAALVGEPYAVALFDLDRFKPYNDRFGHPGGDAALRSVAGLMERVGRRSDRLYRYGGEELLLLLRGVTPDQAPAIVERHRAAVEEARLPHPDNAPFGIMTVSAGVACVLPGETAEEVSRRADEALYSAKASGRNRVVVSSPVPAPRAPVVDPARRAAH